MSKQQNRLNARISDRTKKMFEEIVTKYRGLKGSLSLAVDEALQDWVKKENSTLQAREEREKRVSRDPYFPAVRIGKDGSQAGPLILGWLVTLARGRGPDAEEAKERLENYGLDLSVYGIEPRAREL